MKSEKKISRGHHTDHVAIDTHVCQACWHCVEACPKGVLGKVNVLGLHKHAKVSHAEACVGCLLCVKACPHGAISQMPKP